MAVLQLCQLLFDFIPPKSYNIFAYNITERRNKNEIIKF